MKRILRSNESAVLVLLSLETRVLLSLEVQVLLTKPKAPL